MKRTASSIAAVLLLAGCGSDGTDAADERPESTPLEADAKQGGEDDPFAPNVGDRALTVGEMRDGEAIDTTLEQIRFPQPPAEFREPAEGNVFVGLRLEQCMTEQVPDAYATYNGEWAIVTPNGEEYAGSGSSWDDFPSPKFPENVTLTTDRCLKGWTQLEVPEGTKIASVVYRPLGQTVAEWLP